MEEKKEFKLFREKSMEAIESPESMNDYLQVTSPGIWLVLAAIIAILIGAILWSIFGRINTKVNVAVVSKDGSQICYVPYDKLQSVISAGVVDVEGQMYPLTIDAGSETTNTIIISESTNPYVRVAGDLQIGDIAVAVPVDSDLANGVYTGHVITESLQPISLLIQ